MVVPEFRWPMTPLTLASTSFCATMAPCFGSAASSSASSSNLTLAPPIFHALGVQFLDGEAGAILVILAQVGLRAGHRRDMAELDHDLGLANRRGRRGHRLRLLLLATGGQRKGGNNGEGNNGKLRAHRYFS